MDVLNTTSPKRVPGETVSPSKALPSSRSRRAVEVEGVFKGRCRSGGRQGIMASRYPERYKRMRRTTPVLVAVLALLLAAPLAAYTIYLKDGRTLNIKGKPRIVNGRALVTLPNGTQASLDPAQIDDKKTEEMNQRDLGAAVILDQGVKQQQATAAPTPTPQSRLSDISAREIGLRDQPARRNPAAPAGRSAENPSSRAPYGDAAVASELSQFFLGQK